MQSLHQVSIAHLGKCTLLHYHIVVGGKFGANLANDL